MNKNLLMTVFIIVAVVLVGFAIVLLRGAEDSWLCVDGQWVEHGKPSAPKPITDCGVLVATTTPLNNSTSTVPNVSEANITLTAPSASSTVNQVFSIVGQARVFESSLIVRVLTADGTKILEKPVMANAPDAGQFGLFYYNVDLNDYPDVKAGQLTIEALDYSAKDGAEIDKTSVVVYYLPTAVSEEKTRFKVYFGNSQLNPDANPCSAVFAASRIVDKTTGIAKAAIEELLQGPTEAEKSNQFYTSINPETKLQKITIVDGIARVDFSEALSQTAGSCKVEAISSQIIETLKQFPSVNQVIISVNGQTEGILEP